MLRNMFIAATLTGSLVLAGCAGQDITTQTPQQRLDTAKLIVGGLETGYGVICGVKPQPSFCDQVAYDAAESAVDGALDAIQTAITAANGAPLDPTVESDLFAKLATATADIEKLVNGTKAHKHQKDKLAAPVSQ